MRRRVRLAVVPVGIGVLLTACTADPVINSVEHRPERVVVGQPAQACASINWRFDTNHRWTIEVENEETRAIIARGSGEDGNTNPCVSFTPTSADRVNVTVDAWNEPRGEDDGMSDGHAQAQYSFGVAERTRSVAPPAAATGEQGSAPGVGPVIVGVTIGAAP